MKKPWEQKPNEPKEAFEALERFLKAGSLRRLDHAVGTGCPLYQVMGWSRQWKWSARAEAYDNYIDRPPLVIEDMDAEVDKYAADALVLMRMEMAKWLAVSMASDMPGAIPLRDVARTLDMAMKLRQLRKGLPTENVHYDDPRMSDEDFEALGKLLAKAEAAAAKDKK